MKSITEIQNELFNILENVAAINAYQEDRECKINAIDLLKKTINVLDGYKNK